MDHMWERIGSQLIARVSGPMKFRLVLQPCMAAFFAIRAGLADVKAGKPPWFWELVSNPPNARTWSRRRGSVLARCLFSRWYWTLCTSLSSYILYIRERRLSIPVT
jgi:hypothetical protein